MESSSSSNNARRHQHEEEMMDNTAANGDAYVGEDDSFEDADGVPRYTFLYEYVQYKVSHGLYVVNTNGYSEPKQTASVDELGIYYCTHPVLIRDKQDKYEAYNKRLRRVMSRDYIYSKNNEQHYMYIGRAVDRYRRQHEAEYIDPIAAHRRHGGLGLTGAASSMKAPHVETKEERTLRIHEAIRTRTLRIEDVNTEKELYDYFAFHIRHQPHATRAIAHAIFSMKSHSVDEGDSDQNANIRSILASGVSGTGKSAIINLVRPLFRMEPGAVNEECYAELRFANVSDSSHRNAINGTGAGFDGMHEDCLVDRLEHARVAIEARGPSHSQQPNIILVYIDEICKPATEVRVLDSLNSLFAEGILTRASGNVTFKLPDNVKMLFYSTANYGEAKIVNYDARRDYSRALEAIKRDMMRKKVRECDIGRIGEIVPFFALRPEQARQIMKFNLDCYFGAKTPRSFTMADEDRVRFVDFYFEGNYTPAHGMRMPNKKIKQELQHIRALQRQPGVTTPAITTTPSLRFDIIAYPGFDRSLQEICEAHPILAKAIAYDEMNEENLVECIEACADIGYASLCHQGEPFFVYIARPQSYHRGDDDDEEEGGGGDDEDYRERRTNNNNHRIVAQQPQALLHTRIRELISSPEHHNNPLVPLLREIVGGGGGGGEGGDPVQKNKKRPLSSNNNNHEMRQKRQRIEEEEEEEESGNDEEEEEETRDSSLFDTLNESTECSISVQAAPLTPNGNQRRKCPVCGNYKPESVFLKKYKYKDTTKCTQSDTCSTCRKKKVGKK